MRKFKQAIAMSSVLMSLGAMGLGGCQSPAWKGGSWTPTVEPEVAGLTPEVAELQALNQRARRQVGQITPGNVPEQKPRVLATLKVQRRALTRAAATVAEVRTAASREDMAMKQAVIAAQRATEQLSATRELLQQSQQRYHNAWLGGKAHRLIDWIVGLAVAAVVLDFLADAFLGIGFNPLEWIAGLSGFAKKKLV